MLKVFNYVSCFLASSVSQDVAKDSLGNHGDGPVPMDQCLELKLLSWMGQVWNSDPASDTEQESSLATGCSILKGWCIRGSM